MTEAELIARARTGSGTAFAGLVELYQIAVVSLCYRMLGDAGEAEEAAQESFLRAYSQFHRYDPGRSFKTWLYAIASHYCIDRLRRRRILWVGIDDEPLLGHPALREPNPGPEQMAALRERDATIRAALSALAPRDRAVIVMSYWYDLSYAEIAEALGSTTSAVKSRLHRARVALGEILRSEEQRRATAELPATAPSGAPEEPPAPRTTEPPLPVPFGLPGRRTGLVPA